MNTVSRNLAASLIGGAWTSALSLLLIPTYLWYLGPEAYGLIGLHATLLAAFTLFDLGLGGTLSRGLARLSADPSSRARQRDLLRTFECVYHGIAVALGALLFSAAPVVARHWVRGEALSLPELSTAIRLMAVMCALQFPSALYHAGLQGLQQHVRLNAVVVAGATVRALGAVAVLLLVSRSIVAFFAWQAVIAAAQTAGLFAATWRLVGGATRARFDGRILRAEWRLAASLSANAVALACVTQADKVILSGLVPLTELGYYSLAGTVASALWLVILPVNSAVSPRFTQLLAADDRAALVDVYHKACQTIALLVLPIGVTLALFSHAVVEAWTGNPVAAERAGPIVPLLVTGTTLWGLTSVPACLQYAGGWPHLMLRTNLVAAVVLVPATVYAVSRVGAPGAALAWRAATVAYAVPATLMFRMLIPGERRRWWLRDVVLPLVVAVAVGGALRAAMPPGLDRAAAVTYLVACAACVFAAVLALTPDVRAVAARRVRAWAAPRDPARRDSA